MNPDGGEGLTPVTSRTCTPKTVSNSTHVSSSLKENSEHFRQQIPARLGNCSGFLVHACFWATELCAGSVNFW